MSWRQVFEYLSTDLKKYMDRNGKGPSNPMHPDVIKVWSPRKPGSCAVQMSNASCCAHGACALPCVSFGALPMHNQRPLSCCALPVICTLGDTVLSYTMARCRPYLRVSVYGA